MKIKTSELSGAALNWAVAKCEERTPFLALPDFDDILLTAGGSPYLPSQNWSQGGPIIERENISFQPFSGDKFAWKAHKWAWSAPNGMMLVQGMCIWGETPLIAAMRCYVASKLGDEVEIPNELI